MGYKVAKTVRIEPKIWNDAKEKARDEGYTMEGLIKNLLLNYLTDKKGR